MRRIRNSNIPDEYGDLQFDGRVYTCPVFVVVSNTDLVEGRGKPIEIGYYAREMDAKFAARGCGLGGRDAEVVRYVRNVLIPLSHAGSIECWDQALMLENMPKKLEAVDSSKVRNATLAKLSHEEQEYLGLTEQNPNSKNPRVENVPVM